MCVYLPYNIRTNIFSNKWYIHQSSGEREKEKKIVDIIIININIVALIRVGNYSTNIRIKSNQSIIFLDSPTFFFSYMIMIGVVVVVVCLFVFLIVFFLFDFRFDSIDEIKDVQVFEFGWAIFFSIIIIIITWTNTPHQLS